MVHTTVLLTQHKMNAIKKQIHHIERVVQSRSLWHRIKHHLYLTPEAAQQHELRLEWLRLAKINSYYNY